MKGGIATSNPRAMQNYLTNKYKYLERRKFFEKIRGLDTTADEALAEELDNIMVEVSLLAEKKGKNYPAIPYSPEIQEMRKIYTIHKIHVQGLRSHRQFQTQIQRRLQGLSRTIKPH